MSRKISVRELDDLHSHLQRLTAAVEDYRDALVAAQEPPTHFQRGCHPLALVPDVVTLTFKAFHSESKADAEG